MQEAGRRNRYCKGHQTWRGWVWWAARCVMGAIGVWRAGLVDMRQGAAEGPRAVGERCLETISAAFDSVPFAEEVVTMLQKRNSVLQVLQG